MRYRALVVDDSPQFASTVEGILSESFDVTVALSAEEALSLDLCGLHVICSDLSMPGMDGLAFLEKVRGACPLIGLLLMTGMGELGSAEGSRLEKLDAVFVRKPFDPEFLLLMLTTLAQTAHLRSVNRATN